MGRYNIGPISVSATSGGVDLDTDRPVVVLVHGAGMDRTVWSLQTRWLAHHGMNALAVDLPGHGGSANPPLDSIQSYARWLGSLADALPQPVHLVGHSMGSFIAVEAAAACDVASVTLVGVAAAMPVHPKLVQAAEANDPLAAQLMSGWAFAHATRGGAHPSPGSTMVGGTQAMIARCAPGVLHGDLTQCGAYENAVEAAGAISSPITFLLGEIDRMTPPANAKPLIDAAQTCRVEVVSRVGHMIQTEAPNITRKAIFDTVTSV